MRRAALIPGLILLVGIAASVVAIKAHESDTQFVAVQRTLVPVRAQALQQLIQTTRDPRPAHHGLARSAHCVSQTSGSGLGNPWSCVVRYPQSPAVRYRVQIHSDRSIQGEGQPEGTHLNGALVLKGCCVAMN